MNETLKKVIIFTYPYVGHTNPILAVCNQLKIENKNIQIIVYSRKHFKQLIENTGAEFKDYNLNEMDTEEEDSNIIKELNIASLVCLSLDWANKLAENLINDVLDIKPDLIMYDQATIFGRLTIDCLLNKFKTIKPFKIIRYSTTLLLDRYYPDKNESKHFKISNPLKTLFYFLMFIIKLFLFYFKHGIYNKQPTLLSLADPLPNETSLIFIFPQLQPRSETRCKKTYKFVGCSLNDKFHSTGINKNEITNDLSLFLNNFPIKSNIIQTEYDLIYVSFGSVLQNQIECYLKIINGLVLLNEEKKIKVIVSTGRKCFASLTQNYDIPEFVTLVESAPQIEILKRASLFITHCGMNSVSESIHYGVPMLCLPMTTDQPLLAFRIADQLGLGLRLSPKCLDVLQIKEACFKLMTDASFRNNCFIYKQYSQNSNGVLNSVKIIKQVLN